MITRAQPWLGTLVEISADRATAIDAGFAAIARVHAALNVHDAASELSGINRSAHRAPVRLSRAAAAVIGRAQFWARLSDGSFDASDGHWRAVQLVGRSIAFARPLRLDLSGIAKGFAVDRAIAALRAAGAGAALVNAGGDLRGFGGAFPVTLVRPDRTPLARLMLRDAALASSAPRPDGSAAHLPRRAAHIIGVSVEARRAIDADALTKIVLADGPAADRCLAAVGALALVQHADGRTHWRGAVPVAA